MMSLRSGGMSAILVLLLLVGGFVFLLVNNAPSTEPLRVIIPTQSAAMPDDANAWKRILEAGFGADTTPLPTVPLPTAGFSVPTLAIAPATPIAPDAVAVVSGVQSFSIGATPTPLPPTALPLATTVPLTAIAVSRPSTAWQPPPLMPPISRDALGRDHYYLMRPVDSNANNRGLFYYGYGSDGPENNWRIHAGIDMPNDIGQTVRAAGAGVIIWRVPAIKAPSAMAMSSPSLTISGMMGAGSTPSMLTCRRSWCPQVRR